MTPLRVAVIGAGHLGRIHARIAAGIEDIKLVAVADPVAICREAAATEGKTRGDSFDDGEGRCSRHDSPSRRKRKDDIGYRCCAEPR